RPPERHNISAVGWHHHAAATSRQPPDSRGSRSLPAFLPASVAARGPSGRPRRHGDPALLASLRWASKQKKAGGASNALTRTPARRPNGRPQAASRSVVKLSPQPHSAATFGLRNRNWLPRP